jgi:hypothetical protein
LSHLPEIRQVLSLRSHVLVLRHRAGKELR